MRITAATCLCLALLSTSACGSDAEPSAPPTPADSVATTSAAPPEDTASQTTTAAPEDSDAEAMPELPDEAREQTEAGAEAFVEHYIQTINRTSIDPEPGLLESLATENCSSCRNHEATVVFSAREGETLREPLWTSTSRTALLRDSSTRATVRSDIAQHAQMIYDAQGEKVSEIEAADTTLVFTLVWDDGWLVDEIQVES